MKNKSFTHRSVTLLLTTLLLLVAIPVSAVLAASTSPFDVNATVSNNGTLNPNNGWTSNDSYTDFDNQSDTVEYGFADLGIPPGSTIDGIEVKVEGYRQTGARNFTTALWNTSALNPDAYTSTKTVTPTTTDAVYTLGGPTDKWGTTWTVNDFADATFKIRIGVTSSMGATSRLDAVSVKVYYRAPQATLTVNNPGTIAFGSTVTLSTSGGSGTGAVTYSAGPDCSVAGDVLSVTNASGTCSVTASKAGDSDYLAATSTPFTVTMAKADTVTLVTGGTFTYDATAHGATVKVTGPGGLNLTPAASYSGSCSTAPTTVLEGASCTAAYSYAGDNNYLPSSDSDSILINEADASCSVIGFSGPYDGTSHGASGSCSGVGGENAGTLDLGASFTDFPGGSAHWTFTGNDNYKDQFGDVAIDISKADASCSVSGYSGVYDATAHGASGSCSGVGDENAGTLDLGASFTDFPGGSAHWTFTGNGNYKDQAGDVAIDISKADASCTVNGFSGSYDGSAHGASGSCSGVGGEDAGTLDLGASYTDFPGGSAHWSLTASNNYKDQSGDVAIEISKANAVISVLPYDVIYDGSAHVATGSVTGVNGEDLAAGLDLSATSHTAAASYDGDAWTFTAPNANYKDASGTVDNRIAPADAVIVVNGYSVTYDGSAHTSTGTATGVLGEDLGAYLDLSASTHTDIGEYNDAWVFTAPSANYNDKSGTVKNVISAKLIPALNLSGGPFTYDNSPHAATVTSPVAGTVSDVKYVDSLAVSSSDAPVNAGTYTVTADFLPVDTATYETLNDVTVGAITIGKAQPSCTINTYTVVYNGASHTATGSCLGVGDVVLTGLDLSGTTHTDVGTYDDSWTFTDVTGNYNNDSGTVQNVISADTTAPVVSSAVRADANDTAATRVHFTVTFSEAVTGVNTSAPYADFSLFTTGLGGASITDVSGSGATYNVTVNTGVGSGTIRLDVVDDDSILDVGSNPLGGSGNGSGNFTGEMYTIVKAPSFADVPASNPYYQDIEILYANGLTGGCGTSPLKFCPDKTMNRGEAAVFILRGTYGASFTPSPATHIFKDDWSKGSWAEPWAEAMRSTGLSAGCFTNPLRYCPWDQMPREQVVIFALRLKYGVNYTPPAATGTVFADMTNAGYYATAWAEQAYKDGLISNCGMSGGKPKFCPKDGVSRGLAAHIIVTAKNLSMP